MPRSSRPRRARRPLPPGFGVIWTTVALDLLGFGILFPVLARYAEDFGASATTAGLLVASFSVAQLLCAPLWGRVSDRVGRKPVLIVSLVGTAVGSLLTGLAGSLWILFAGRVVDGVSGASVSVAQASVTDVAAPEERPRLLGLLGAAFGFGFLAGPIIGGVTALIDRRAPFIVAAGIAAVNAAVAVRRLPETHPRRAGATATPTFSRSTAAESAPVDLQNGDRPFSRSAAAESTAGNLENESGGSGLGRLILVGFVSLVAFSGFEATFSLLVQDRFGLSESATYGVFAVIGLFLVLVQGGLVHPVHSKLGETTTIRFGLACNGLGLALVAVDAGWLVLTPGLALLIVGQGLLTPTLSSAVAARSSTARRGTNLGWQQSAGGLARVVGPAMAGALFQHVGVPAPYALGAALLLLALGLVPVAPRHELFPVVTGR